MKILITGVHGFIGKKVFDQIKYKDIRGIGRELFFEIYDGKVKNILLIINFNFFNQINKIKDYSLFEQSSRNYINKYSLIENILD